MRLLPFDFLFILLLFLLIKIALCTFPNDAIISLNKSVARMKYIHQEDMLVVAWTSKDISVYSVKAQSDYSLSLISNFVTAQ